MVGSTLWFVKNRDGQTALSSSSSLFSLLIIMGWPKPFFIARIDKGNLRPRIPRAQETVRLS
jgi:hypothetical protein